MKTLLILRHAKADWDGSARTDHERPLTRRGRKDAPRVGQRLADEGLLPDGILGSTAARVRETVELLAAQVAYRGPIEFRPDFYLAPPRAYWAAVRTLPDAWRIALVVGHNPGLEDFVWEITGQQERLPTATLVQVQWDVAAWSELERDAPGQLVAVWRPKDDEE